MRLVIAVPTYGTWEADFGQSLALTMADLAARDLLTQMRLTRCESTIIPAGRHDLAKDALEQNATHILWADSDMKFKPANVHRLLSRADHAPIVGVDYWMRNPPYGKTAKWFGGKPEKTEGIEEVDGIGFGLCITDMDIFRKMEKPWFETPWNPEKGDYDGEDILFCRRAREAGFKTYVDHDASIGIGHCGRFVFQDSD